MTLSEAKTHVEQVVNNRSSIKEVNLYNAWSNSAITADYVENRSDLAPNIDDGFAAQNTVVENRNIEYINDDRVDPRFDISEGGWGETVTLSNGTTHQITAIKIQVEENYLPDDEIGGEATNDSTVLSFYPGNATQSVDWDYQFQGGDVETASATVKFDHYYVKRNQSSEADAIISDSGKALLADADRWSDLLGQIEQQNQDTIQTVHSIADRKYSAIKAGEVKLPTNQNPYYASEMGAAENYSSEAFTASWLSSQGVSNPEDWQNLKTTTFSFGNNDSFISGQPLGLDDGTTIREGRNYSVNDTGTLTVATPSGTRTIDSGNFTVESIDGLDGNKSSLTFESENLSVSNITDYRDAVDWMKEEQAESEAREKKQEDKARKSGGGLLPSGLGLDSPFSGDTAIIGLIVLGIALLAIVARVATGDN
jgi:hypothetical protein